MALLALLASSTIWPSMLLKRHYGWQRTGLLECITTHLSISIELTKEIGTIALPASYFPLTETSKDELPTLLP